MILRLIIDYYWILISIKFNCVPYMIEIFLSLLIIINGPEYVYKNLNGSRFT